MVDPTGPNDRGLPDPKTQSCDTKACQLAKAATVDTANEISFKCSDIAAASARAAAYLAIVGAILGVAGAIISYLIGSIGLAAAWAVLVAGIVNLNFLLAVAFLVLASIALTFLTLYAITQIQVAILQANLSALQNKFKSQADQVMLSCHPLCWGDLEIPRC